MTKSISAGLKSHQEGEVTTIAMLWKVTRADGQVFGFTNASHDILYMGVTYKADTGHTPTNIKTTVGMNVDNMDVVSVLDDSTITEADISAGLWDFAEVLIVSVNYSDLGQGHKHLRRGWIGQVTTGRTQFTAELRGMAQPFQQITGRIYSAACDADLGDARCGINLNSYKVSGTVSSVDNARVIYDDTRAELEDYFVGGKISFLSGANTGLSMEVKYFTHVGSPPLARIELQELMPNPVIIGDTYEMVPGCDKLVQTCLDKYNNVLNHRGFPTIPGSDSILSGG